MVAEPFTSAGHLYFVDALNGIEGSPFIAGVVSSNIGMSDRR